jgi:alpha-D-ribose 1-methylphosphonate 5-triphosphate synthase subunit PhnG
VNGQRTDRLLAAGCAVDYLEWDLVRRNALMAVGSNVARTSVQLLNQLIETGRSEEMLRRVRAACDLGNELYSGRLHGDGKPFVAHTIAVASVAARLGLSDDVVVAAVVHNVYCNADFGDGLVDAVTQARRALVRERIGAAAEALVRRFRRLRLRESGANVSVDALPASDRELLLLDLADHFEKYLDASLAYYRDPSWIREFDVPHRAALRDLAERLGHPAFGDELVDAMERQVEWFEKVPASLRTGAGPSVGLHYVPPRSAGLRLAVRWMRWRSAWRHAWADAVRPVRHAVRLRTRMRSLLHGLMRRKSAHS